MRKVKEMRNEIAVKLTAESRINMVDFDNIQFGRIFSDHQFIATYENEEWKNFEIVPYGNLSLSPATSAIHYGQAIFEGMKAHKNADEEILLFRPLDNWNRLNLSAQRMAMPSIPQDIFMNALEALLKIDKVWIPTKAGSSLYIRPFMFATDDFIGVQPSKTYKFIIFTCPVNAYYNEPLKIKAETQYIRAAEGGVGFAKCAGNYAAALMPTAKAQHDGFNQILWLDAKEHQYLEETGTTNIFVRIENTVYTPSLQSNTILNGITRDSIIKIARHNNLTVIEEPISIHRLFDAHEKGLLRSAFVTGTAATLTPIAQISYLDKSIILNPDDSWDWFRLFKHTIEGIKTGNIEDPFNWIVKVS